MFSSKQSTARPNGYSGFTIIELLVTMSIAAILGTLALPGYTSIMTRHRLSNENTNLMLDFVLARGEALTRATRVTVCQSGDGASCTAGGWQTGRVVFVDRGAAGSIDAGDEILKVSAAIASGDSMSAATTTAVSYNAAGIPSTNITIITCKSGYTGAQLVVYPTGRLRADSHGVCI
jgi:type IV fimbrial biogenesis protein FimT